ncbi:HTH_Tnp_Tc3_2 domain-containing protein [Trichonephila clavipes]|uniref:HTH_Tnp_Tc3_2 domain-containing protein n=1 Tax=Trichonephila clavipes TaxID=2585209 RepID=A0A8X6SZI4_TRICX|nr:HTH_Tnp_Tc3_2 domain-containing protein [Trichonephila clavipes]
MLRVTSRNTYRHVSEFDKGRIVAYRNCGLSYHCVASRVGQDPMSVIRILNRWVQKSSTERRAESQRSPITSSREDPHSLNGSGNHFYGPESKIRSFARQQVSARTV